MLRVVQSGTGNVGRRTMAAVIDHPELDLVGCFASDPAKRGVDAGVLCGREDIGVQVTGDLGAVLATRPDVWVYTPRYIDVDFVCTILEAGANVVTTTEVMTGDCLGPEVIERLDGAAKRGGASFFGTGLCPGMIQSLAITASSICQRVDSITVTESVNVTAHDCAEVHIAEGFGCPADTEGLIDRTRKATRSYEDGLHFIARALRTELDDITFEAEYVATETAIDVGFMRIEPGCIVAMRYVYTGWVAGNAVVKQVEVKKMHDDVAQQWELINGYRVEIVGLPGVVFVYHLFPPLDWDEEGYQGLGMIASGLPAVNAIRATCAARPGFVTYTDLPPTPGPLAIPRPAVVSGGN
jgi:2,4-diaminopentanoate dehydrogenase